MGLRGVSSSAKRILWSRLLTHSGDQAWDFALPLAMVRIVPGGLGTVAFYFLVVRIAHVLLIARVCNLLDSWNRLNLVKAGIGAQTFGVALALVSIAEVKLDSAPILGDLSTYSWWFLGLIVAGVISSLGANLMEVAVSQDWLPTVVPLHELAHVNSHLKQIDLFTELSAPIVAGMLLAIPMVEGHPVGLYAIAAWNLVSFCPEYGLLRRVYRNEPRLGALKSVAPKNDDSFFGKLTGGWRDFASQSVAFSMIAYAVLWLSILSPHGVLLSGWLKTEWRMSEVVIGLFRGLGAVFGLLATVAFPFALRRLSLVSASRGFIIWQAICLIVGGIFFSQGRDFGIYFMAFILLSRVGLYGFSLGETEIRQISILEHIRGRVNGVGSALTSIATVAVYAAGTQSSSERVFDWLVYGSIGSVCFAAIIFTLWSISGSAEHSISSPHRQAL
jgi:iron-regulated transporter 1